MLDAISYKMASDALGRTHVPATSIIENGDFSQGTDGWLFSNAGSPQVIDGALVFTPTDRPSAGSTDQHVYQSFLFPQGALLYASVWVFGDESVCLKWTTHTMDQVTTPFVWQRLSGVRQASPGIRRALGVRDQKSEDWGETRIRSFLAIDLTSTFGAGNEPAKEDMDSLLDALFPPDGWFGGTKNLFDGKAFMSVYFSVMKELRNAVTLGGGV